jgi:acyl dehydratase
MLGLRYPCSAVYVRFVRSLLRPQAAVQTLHFEDFVPGTVIEFGPRVLTREEIVTFAAEFDPQPMHLDEAAASASMLGGLAASGWHSCCMLMRMLSDHLLSRSSFMGAPGIEEVRWLAPVRAGEPITVRATVLETRPSRSRQNLGFVRFRFELIDRAGARLMEMIVSPMFGRHTAGAGSGTSTANEIPARS